MPASNRQCRVTGSMSPAAASSAQHLRSRPRRPRPGAPLAMSAGRLPVRDGAVWVRFDGRLRQKVIRPDRKAYGSEHKTKPPLYQELSSRLELVWHLHQ